MKRWVRYEYSDLKPYDDEGAAEGDMGIVCMLFGTVPVYLGNYDEPVKALFTSPVVGPKDRVLPY